jgi:GNAT superfamily N-acetyltransferase
MHSYQSSLSSYNLRHSCKKDNLNIFILLSIDYYKILIIIDILICIVFLLIPDNTAYYSILIPVLVVTIISPVLTWLEHDNLCEQAWVVEYKNRIVGCALVKKYAQYSELLRLHVHASHRKKGVGSCLVRTVIREIPKPIYLVSAPKALHFYTKLSFYPIPRHRLPRRLSDKSRIGFFVLGYIPTDN